MEKEGSRNEPSRNISAPSGFKFGRPSDKMTEANEMSIVLETVGRVSRSMHIRPKKVS
jgi:hypothetical protein